VKEDRELELWREQWRSAPESLPDIRARVERQTRNMAIRLIVRATLVSMLLALSVVAVVREPTPGRIVWAIGLWTLVISGVAATWKSHRDIWRPATETTRAFAELFHRRAVAKLHVIRWGFYGLIAWVVFYAALCVWRWPAARPDVEGHPVQYVIALVGSLLMVAAGFGVIAWLRRRRLVELKEAKKLLDSLSE
jgi:hypothetical protein